MVKELTDLVFVQVESAPEIPYRVLREPTSTDPPLDLLPCLEFLTFDRFVKVKLPATIFVE